MLQKYKVIVILVGMLIFSCGCGKKDAEMLSIMSDVQEESAIDKEEQNDKDFFQNGNRMQSIYVQVEGAVKKPGVYELKEGDRIFQVIELAGGFLKEACRTSVNQAAYAEDGSQIVVLTQKEMEQRQAKEEQSDSGKQDDGRINVNTASMEQLMTLSGVGQSKAESILKYRQEHGSFASIDELMNIPGIKQGVFNKIKDYITI